MALGLDGVRVICTFGVERFADNAAHPKGEHNGDDKSNGGADGDPKVFLVLDGVGSLPEGLVEERGPHDREHEGDDRTKALIRPGSRVSDRFDGRGRVGERRGETENNEEHDQGRLC